MDLLRLKNLYQNFELLNPNELATELFHLKIMNMHGNLYDHHVSIASFFPTAVWSVSKPFQGKKPPTYENKELAIKKKLPFEAFIASDDRIGEPSHFFASENSSDPNDALAKTLVKLLIQVEEDKLAKAAAKSKGK